MQCVAVQAVEDLYAAGCQRKLVLLIRALREYVHIGIGCDCCGAYPIRGKRFKCLDCPEAVGFDLCEACHRGSLVSYGRFNQRHVAGGVGTMTQLHVQSW